MTIDFKNEVKPLIGQKVTRAWKGYGSAIFLEIGPLASLSDSQRSPRGTWGIMVEWDWRIELNQRILVGSSNDGCWIVDHIKVLVGKTIQGIDLWGEVPELLVAFSGGYRLRSAAMVASQPEWAVRVNPDRWLSAVDGRVHANYAGPGLSEEERIAFARAKETADRWGAPEIESESNCFKCQSYVRLCGEGNLHDYGVCASAKSVHDGKVVHFQNGCPAFESC